MKFIFAGTTEFGIPSLEKLISQGNELLFVITQPDKPTGRSQQLSPPPIKTWAAKHNITIHQPVRIIELVDQLKDAEADLLLVAAYGQIIPEEILNIPKYGSVNIHGSILPKYRGASPIQAAILNGDEKTGVTLIKMDAKMDHGPILGIKEVPLPAVARFPDVYKSLANVSAELVTDILPKYLAGTLKPAEQKHDQATFTKLLKKENARIDWTRPAREIYNQIRALNPEPGTWTTLNESTVKILEAKILPETKIELAGKLYRTMDGLAVKAVDQSLLITQIQPEGKKPMSGKNFLNGLRDLDRKHFV